MSHQTPFTTRLRTLALTGAMILCSFAAPAAMAADSAPAAALTPAQQTAVTGMIHDYLIAHPEVIVEGLNGYQRTQEKNESAQFSQNLIKHKAELVDASTPFAGNPNGSKVIVEFFDYNCPYCKRALDDVQALIQQDKEIKIYLKDFPVLSSTSTDASHWALAAGKQGKYFQFYVAMLKTPTPGERSTKEMYVKIGKDLGLDIDKMEKDAETDPGIKAAVEKNLELARELGIRGTPAFIMGDQLFPGYMGLDNMKKALAEAGTAKPGEPGNGTPAAK